MPTIIDLRSDTVTLPPPEMRRAMYEAELGDDVYREDPTINRLQARTAALLGMEAALFVPSGTMGNLVAVLTHCRRGDEIILGDESHMFHYEGGNSSVLGGTAMHPVPNAPDGTIRLETLRAAVRDPADEHCARTALICLENTHNRCGGAVLEPAYMEAVRTVADEIGVPVHLDGARLFNAAVYCGVPVRELVRYVDSVSFCFSKGLAAPVGSILCGSRAFIAEALRWRKLVGGGMRQAGVLAAAGLYALEHMVERLADDHDNARALADGLSEIRGLRLAQPDVQTNIVIVDVAEAGVDPLAFVHDLEEVGVLGSHFGGSLVRFVTHYGIERSDVEKTVARVHQVMTRRSFSTR
jgi:threonine aldolase